MPPKKAKKTRKPRATKPTQIQKQKQNVKINISGGGGGGGPVFIPQAQAPAPIFMPQPQMQPNIFNVMPSPAAHAQQLQPQPNVFNISTAAPNMLSAPHATPSSVQAAMNPPVAAPVETLEKDLKKEVPVEIPVVEAWPAVETKPARKPRRNALGGGVHPAEESMEYVMPAVKRESKENVLKTRIQPTPAEVFGETMLIPPREEAAAEEDGGPSIYDSFNIGNLRDYARELGIAPGNKKKGALIKEIKKVRGAEDEGEAGQALLERYGIPAKRGRKPRTFAAVEEEAE